jgi:heme exporter protein A
LRILAGLSTPESGEIRLNGTSVKPFDPTLRATITFAGHHPALKDELTAEENLSTLVALAGETASREALREALDAVALTRQRTRAARVLSPGQRRRIGLARVIGTHRPLWILDEPVTALDAAGSTLLGTMVTEHLERGGAAVAATHAPLGWAQTRTRSLALS